ncbi:hypothetical protein F5Y16DRAFT_370925 [Xylariaceae sp. FL0255]|nr:hypothetical protein F5Y16DRAFT_370925 [Xylariaceae sp. FL0255]
MIPYLPKLLGVFLAAAWMPGSDAGQISAWYPASGSTVPQIVMWNETLGKLQYSLCNSTGRPIFTGKDSATFEFQSELAPMNGTSVGGFSYADINGTFTTYLWYQLASGAIGEAIFLCNITTGLYSLRSGSNWDITSAIPNFFNLQSLTDIVAFNIDGGQVVVVENDLNQPSVLNYTSGWSYLGPVNQDPDLSPGLSAASASATDFTIISNIDLNERNHPRLDASYYQQNGTWDVATLPYKFYLNTTSQNTTDPWITNQTDWYEDNDIVFPYESTWSLEAYNSSVNLGLAVNSSNVATAFYIGTDALLHEIQQIDLWTWTSVDAQNGSIWPEADEPNANLGIAYNGNDVWLYYTVDGSLMQVSYTDDEWAALAVPKFANTTDSSSGKSSSVKVGVGVGVGLGLPLLIGACALYMFWHSKRSRENRDRETAAVQAAHTEAITPNANTISYPGSPAPQYTSGTYGTDGYWSNGQWVAKDQIQQYGNNQGWGKPEKDIMYQELPSETGPQEMPTQESAATGSSARPISEMPSEPHLAPRGSPTPVSPQLDHSDTITSA